jgi:hypothetical protein
MLDPARRVRGDRAPSVFLRVEPNGVDEDVGIKADHISAAIKICQDERLPLGGSDASVLQAQPAQWFLP